MTNQEMAERLGIPSDELEILEAQEAAHSLPGGYPTLELHLGRMLRDKWTPRWSEIKRKVGMACSRSPDFETEEFRLQKLENLLKEFGL